jgi:hypothetical protein
MAGMDQMRDLVVLTDEIQVAQVGAQGGFSQQGSMVNDREGEVGD